MNAPVDDSLTQARWLYRRGELLCGPVSTPQLMERLYSGEVDAKTEIAPLGTESFRRLGEMDVFRLHLAKAEAQLRVHASHVAHRTTKQKHRRMWWGVTGLVTLAVSIAAAWAARHFAVHGTLEGDAAETEISIEPPVIALAQDRAGEELVAYPGSGPRRANGSRGMTSRSPAWANTPKGSAPPEEADGMQVAQFDQTNINGVVAAKQVTLKTCFVEEARRQPGFSAKIPIEFVIGNDGRVAKLWVDHPTYKTSPLADCLLRELQKWPFRPYAGTRATVGLSFKIGKG
ncbi:MAG: AgmX/PglI C-terminal domain-containing protein [Myxococcaceae bacterium]